jgi:hypothetical protein
MVDRDGGQHDPKDMICSKFQGKKGQNHVNTLVAVEHLQEFLKSTCHPSFFGKTRKSTLQQLGKRGWHLWQLAIGRPRTRMHLPSRENWHRRSSPARAKASRVSFPCARQEKDRSSPSRPRERHRNAAVLLFDAILGVQRRKSPTAVFSTTRSQASTGSGMVFHPLPHRRSSWPGS